jgi:hypothetical protein
MAAVQDMVMGDSFSDLLCLILQTNPPNQSTFALQKQPWQFGESVRFDTRPRHL